MSTSLAWLRPPLRLPRFARFCLVGASGVVVDLVTFAGLVDAGCPHALAAVGAFLLAVANNLALNRRFTFGARGAAWRFLLVSGAGLVVSLLVLHALERAGVPAVTGQAAAVVVATPLTYVLHRRWTFRAPLTGRSRGTATVRP